MSLRDYIINDPKHADYFETLKSYSLPFPCNECVHHEKHDDEPPCNGCCHNANATEETE